MSETISEVANENNNSPEASQNKEKKPRNFVVILIMILAVVVIAGVVALLIIMSNKKSEEPVSVVNDFVADINKKDYQEAYNSLSDSLKSNVSQESFQADFPSDKYANCTFVQTNELVDGDLKIIDGDLNCENADYKVQFKTKGGKLESYSVARKE
jgi:cytoskeletal protein RodZ